MRSVASERTKLRVLAPNTHRQSFFASHRENFTSARSTLKGTKGLHLAITLLYPRVDGSRPINNLEKENDMPSANGRAKASRLPGGEAALPTANPEINIEACPLVEDHFERRPR